MTPTVERILVTGATGFLGRQVVRRLLARNPQAHLVLLSRARGKRTGADRARTVVKEAVGAQDLAAAAQRVTVLNSDLGLERCGLDDASWEQATSGVTRVIHVAATVNFDEALAVAQRTNVFGTANMLNLATRIMRAGTLRSFTHVSTAYVAGHRHGVVAEDELLPGHGFRNTYERTKFEAEALVRSRQGELPIVIARPSIVIGDSTSGVSTSFNTVYPLKVYASGRWRTVPGHNATVIDIVPVDFVADALVHLAFDPLAVGKCAHLSAGLEGGMTFGEISALASQIFGVPPVRVFPPAFFTALIYPLAWMLLRGSTRRLLQAGYVYVPYFKTQMRFDASVAAALLQPAGITPPHVRDYVERVLVYCRDSDWGRRAVPMPAAPALTPTENLPAPVATTWLGTGDTPTCAPAVARPPGS